MRMESSDELSKMKRTWLSSSCEEPWKRGPCGRCGVLGLDDCDGDVDTRVCEGAAVSEGNDARAERVRVHVVVGLDGRFGSACRATQLELMMAKMVLGTTTV